MAETHTETGNIGEWRSILTLVVFVVTNLIVLFPFDAPVYVPKHLLRGVVSLMENIRIIPPRHDHTNGPLEKNWFDKRFQKWDFPLNFITAPIIADLLLLAVSAIGRKEVKDGTLGTDHIHPFDIMIFFITLAYIAISIDASGLIRWLAFKVLGWGGNVGHRLFFYLYAFFFGLGSFIGNDPIILSGTAFLAYMTRVATNIEDPRAWIYSQFAVANISSAILVSSNPTNLVLAGAFSIKFIVYTANMVVPAVVTGVVLFPFLLYIVFADEKLIPAAIESSTLPPSERGEPVNPNLPYARQVAEDEQNCPEATRTSLEEILNPFLDKGGAAFGAIVMAATLITVLALNAASTSTGQYPVFYVTLPAAFLVFLWDFCWDWSRRATTRAIARQRRLELELAAPRDPDSTDAQENVQHIPQPMPKFTVQAPTPRAGATPVDTPCIEPKGQCEGPDHKESIQLKPLGSAALPPAASPAPTLVSMAGDALRWIRETFPTVRAVFTHLPLALIPFAFAMFVLVQALVSKGWVRVFAHGWGHWVRKTGSVGAVGGMGFLSVILCNFAGTNIGTTILLSRVIQEWYQINEANGVFISTRTFWATVYSMALGVNYGAFSTAFSASLAGLLWRDILRRKLIKVRGLHFARYNFPIIAISMAVGCAVLIGEVYIVYDNTPYRAA